jgi:hypothetical protein
LNGLTSPYEVQLAQQKLATSQKKLTIIPVLQEIVAKEYELLTAEQGKAAVYSQVVAAHRGVATLKETLQLPAILALVNASERYTVELAQQIVYELQIKDEKVIQAGLARDIATESKNQAVAAKEYETKALKVLDEKAVYTNVHNASELTVLNKSIAVKAALGVVETASNSRMLVADEATQAFWLDKKNTIMEYQQQTQVDSSLRNAINSINSEIFQGDLKASTIKQKADLEATAKFVADLTHLIG